MRRALFLAVLAVAALGVPAAASADVEAPIVYISPQDGWAFPQGADFSFGFACVSPSSAIVSCVGSQPLGSRLDTLHAGPHTLTVTATDYEGRQTTGTSTYTVFDTTKPHVIFRTPTEGATFDQGSDVVADYACEDDIGGLGMLEGACIGSLPVGTALDTSRVGYFSFWVDAFDVALNHAAEVAHYRVVDRAPPAITITTPADGAAYTLGQQVSADFGCQDRDGSGVQTCEGDTAWGAPLDTSSLGSRTFVVTASDRENNTSRAQHRYSVIYDFHGFASPAALYPTVVAVKAGEKVPLKFSLHGDRGLDVFAASSPGWQPCGAMDGPSAAQGTLSYNRSADRYTYQASTPKSWIGACRDFVMTLRDGTTHRARFTFTK